jgi:hypothetical protein
MINRNNISKIVVATILVFLTVITQVSLSTAGIIDGKVFVGKTGEAGKQASGEDTLSFGDGKLHSVECDQWGYNKGKYTATKEGNKILFEAETTSPEHGKILWKGAIEGNAVEVEYTWVKKRLLWTSEKQKWFKGTLKQ